MKISEQWLREWINPPVSSEDLGEQLTLMGLEVDEIEPVKPAFSGVVVARIIDTEPHPDADRLKVCRVDAGEGDDAALQIVCGAPNARAGMHVPLATIGARLPGGHKIKKGKLRGVESQGMLCSAAELELSTDADGLMELQGESKVGIPLEELLDLEDAVYHVELTPDRGDCLSVRGVARDLSARNQQALQLHEITAVAAVHDEQMKVDVAADCACARYVGRVITNVDSKAASPTWLVERLRRSGIRSINPAVDVTNYVMLELGQPMHAFDLDKVQGNIGVRRASEGEKVVLLDGREIKLESDTTVITDNRGAIGIAGIMGGDSTGVDENTTRIFFEAALFLPTEIIGKPRRYDAHTDSAHRFERGVDPLVQPEAIEYATSLLQTIAGGDCGPAVDWCDESRLPIGGAVLLRRDRIERLLGIPYEDSDVESILGRLGVKLESAEGGWTVTPPSARYDLRIEEDYIEELARIRGFDNFPRTLNSFQPAFKPDSETEVALDKLKQQLVHRGYREVVTFSFVDDALQHELMPEHDALQLANPISTDLAAMRTSLVPGLLKVMQHNLNRQTTELKIFETGLRFVPSADGLIQESVIGGLVTGKRMPESWNNDGAGVDLFDIKGDIECLAALANRHTIEFSESTHSFLHPGLSGDIVAADEVVGWFGQLHPKFQSKLDLSQVPYLFEIRLDALSAANLTSFTEISRFPSVRRDLSLLVDTGVSNKSLVESVHKYAPDTLQNVLTFDVYSGENIEKGKKSVALGLILQEFSRTLEETEVDQAVSAILAGLTEDLGVGLRA